MLEATKARDRRGNARRSVTTPTREEASQERLRIVGGNGEGAGTSWRVSSAWSLSRMASEFHGLSPARVPREQPRAGDRGEKERGQAQR